MAEIEIRLPKMGESVTEATITNWLKEVGDTIEMDEPLVEVATDKVDNELPSEAEGVLVKKLFEVDDVVQVGDVIAVISTDGDAAAPSADSTPATAEVVAVEAAVISAVAAPVNGVDLPKSGGNGRFYSPLVRSIAKTEGVSIEQLESIQGSGENNRVTKKDILNYIENGGGTASAAPAKEVSQAPAVKKAAPAKTEIHVPDVPIYEGDEIEEMGRMR
ncbi:MAG: 2-oxoglutarate dehydrogenase E2 component (dihydrolipoamide succinyltransferase), partial [Arenicella sp.]